MAVANGRLDTDDLAPIPAGFHTHGTTAYLRADAAASFLRLAAAFETRFGKRLVAMSFYRPLSDQIRIFLKNYYRYNGSRRPGTTDRSYNGSTYRLRAGMAPVASPGYSNHGLAITVDFNAGVQTRGSKEHDWMLAEGTKYGWDWTEGRRIGEPWHWSYMPSKDRMKTAPKAPAPPNHTPVVTVADLAETQRKLTALGYAPGPIDGSLGPSTRAAVKTYQTDRGLAADGSPGPTTRKALDQDMTTVKNLEAQMKALSKQVADIPRLTMQIQVPLEGDQKGQSSNMTGVRKWYAHDIGRIVTLLGEIKSLLLAKRLTDAEVARIADSVQRKIGS